MDYCNGWNTERQWAEFREYWKAQYAPGNEFDKGGVVTVVEEGHEVDVSELPRPLAAFSKRASAAGWIVRNVHSKTHVANVLLASNSKAEGGAEKGSVRTPAHDEDHWSVYALGEIQLSEVAHIHRSFRIHYDTVNGKSKFLYAKLSGKFYFKVGEFDTALSIYIPKEGKK